jgi:hypothetical protein
MTNRLVLSLAGILTFAGSPAFAAEAVILPGVIDMPYRDGLERAACTTRATRAGHMTTDCIVDLDRIDAIAVAYADALESRGWTSVEKGVRTVFEKPDAPFGCRRVSITVLSHVTPPDSIGAGNGLLMFSQESSQACASLVRGPSE